MRARQYAVAGIFGLTAFLATFWLASQWNQSTTELKFAHVGSPGSLFEIAANEFAARANERLPDNFNISVYGGSQLGTDTEVLDKLASGEVTFSLPSTAMSSLSDVFGLFELPFLIRDREQVRKLSEALLEPVLQPAVQEKGLRILAVWENGFRQITNNVRPIHTPDDLRGLKIRIPDGVWREKAFRQLGAEPVPMGLKATYAALQNKEIDGQENPLAQISGSKFDEVQTYLSLSDHVYTPAYVTVNDEQFAKLPPQVQDVLMQTAKELQGWVYARAVAMEGELIENLGKNMETNQVDYKAFQQASRPIYGEFIRSVEGAVQLIEAVKELGEIELTGTNALGVNN